MARDLVLPKKERWTYADYLSLLPPDSSGYQIIEGELIVTPSPRPSHQRIVGRLFREIDDHVIRNDLGEVYIAPLDVVLDAQSTEPENIVQPDILFISKDRLHIVTDVNIQGAPDLAIEIQSESTARYDRVHKMRIYSRFGVPHYWIVDAEARTLEAFDLAEDPPRLAASLAGDDIYRPSLFPGLEIDLGKVWSTRQEEP